MLPVGDSGIQSALKTEAANSAFRQALDVYAERTLGISGNVLGIGCGAFVSHWNGKLFPFGFLTGFMPSIYVVDTITAVVMAIVVLGAGGIAWIAFRLLR